MTDTATITPACFVGLLRALELSGKRRRNLYGRGSATIWAGVPGWMLYTRQQTAPSDFDKLLRGGWEHLAVVLRQHPHRDTIIRTCDTYARELLTSRAEPSVVELGRRLDSAVPADAPR